MLPWPDLARALVTDYEIEPLRRRSMERGVRVSCFLFFALIFFTGSFAAADDSLVAHYAFDGNANDTSTYVITVQNMGA